MAGDDRGQGADAGDPDGAAAILDCDEGRRLGCATFCCRLIVRLTAEERGTIAGRPSGSCLDKGPDGLCEHLDRATHRCRIWQRRPEVCRSYDCNDDPLLAVVLRDGFSTLTRLVRAPRDGRTGRRVPKREGPESL